MWGEGCMRVQGQPWRVWGGEGCMRVQGQPRRVRVVGGVHQGAGTALVDDVCMGRDA